MLSLALQTFDDGRARGANGWKQSADQSDGQGERLALRDQSRRQLEAEHHYLRETGAER